MSKKFLVTSLAALSLSIFAGPSVFAETDAAIPEPEVGETGSQGQSLEQLFATGQALEARLSPLLASEESLPVSPENGQLLSDSINEVNNLLAALRDSGAKVEDAQSLFALRTNLAKRFLRQYEMPGLYEAILTQVPTLETKRYDDAVDFHDFDAELDSLLGHTAYLDQILDFVQGDLEEEAFKKDKVYLKEVALYLIRLQEELYAPEGETVKVPDAPVYWNEEAVPVIDSEGGNNAGSTESTEETGGQGSTESGTDSGAESSSDTTDTGSTEVAEETGDQGSTEPGTDTGTESPSDTTDTGSTESAEETGDQGSTPLSTVTSRATVGVTGSLKKTELAAQAEKEVNHGSLGNQSVSAGQKYGQPDSETGSSQVLPVATTDVSGQESSATLPLSAPVMANSTTVKEAAVETGKPGYPDHKVAPSQQLPVTTAAPTVAQSKAVLPTTADQANDYYLLAGLFLASLGLASMKRRQA